MAVCMCLYGSRSSYGTGAYCLLLAYTARVHLRHRGWHGSAPGFGAEMSSAVVYAILVEYHFVLFPKKFAVVLFLARRIDVVVYSSGFSIFKAKSILTTV